MSKEEVEMAELERGRSAIFPLNMRDSLGRVAFVLSFLVLVTSLLDLFVKGEREETERRRERGKKRSRPKEREEDGTVR